jgi:hypothetical protein
MTHEMNIDKLSELFAEIERAWLDHGDGRVVRDLSERHPEFSDELREFFEDLILGPTETTEEIVKAEDRVSHWLSSTGFEIANAAARAARSHYGTTTGYSSSPSSIEKQPLKEVDVSKKAGGAPLEQSSWVVFLRKRTRQTVPSIAGKLTNMTVEYLVLVSRHPDVVPDEVKTHIAEEVERAWGISVSESIQHLCENPKYLRAASRPGPFEDNPKNFDELLERAALTREQKSYWLGYPKESR